MPRTRDKTEYELLSSSEQSSALLSKADDDDAAYHVARESGDSDFDSIRTDVENEELAPEVSSSLPGGAYLEHLKVDPNEPILTFRFWIISTILVLSGCTISSVYYFKPYAVRVSIYVIQLSAWGLGTAMARWLPAREITFLGQRWNLNPCPFSAKEHSLVLVAYWGSTSTAYGLGPLSAMELYYNKKLDPIWAILFLMCTQMLGYGIAGLYRDILVTPPERSYPVLYPTVALMNSMHAAPGKTARSLQFFAIIAVAAFAYQWLPAFAWPLLKSLPLLCYVGYGSWKMFVLGSGTYGFGMLDLSLDWNYISFFQPLYTPLWANINRFIGAIAACWLLYPLTYFGNTLGAFRFAPMSSQVWNANGTVWEAPSQSTSHIGIDLTDTSIRPHWSLSYAMHFFWGFAATSAVFSFALLFHGYSIYKVLTAALGTSRSRSNNDHSEPTLRAPRWWYTVLFLVCLIAAITQLYVSEMQLPWWGLVLILAISAVFVLPSGLLFSIANVQIGMDYVAELLAGYLFPGKPIAVLTCTVYGRQIMEQCLNLVSDMKFGLYMGIPERVLFVAQLYGTALGPFVNWACMRLIIDDYRAELLGEVPSTAWKAIKTRNFYSLSVIWGVLGPSTFMGSSSPYWWLPLGFFAGFATVFVTWVLHRFRPTWVSIEKFNPAIIFSGAALFPIYPTTNLMTSMLVAIAAMGYVQTYCQNWFNRYNYLLGAALDCGAQLTEIAAVFLRTLSGAQMPYWWGNDPVAVDRCFPPPDLPSAVLN